MHLNTLFSFIVPTLAFWGRGEGAYIRDYTSYQAESNETSFSLTYASLTARQNGRPELRIMPLGASIVSGVGSSTGNG
jgi:hypothetical protein